METQIPSYQVIKEYCIKNLKLVFDFETDLDSLFIKKDISTDTFCLNPDEFDPVFYTWKGYTFPVFIHGNEKNILLPNDKISFDIYLNMFLFLSGYLEKIEHKKDKHDRFEFKNSLQNKFGFVQIPVVNIYFELLFEQALKNGIKIQRKLFENNLIFTHDIDQLRSGWFENIQHYISNFSFSSFIEIPKSIISKILGTKDTYFKAMEKMLKIDQENHIEAISFILTEKSHQDADFDLEKAQYKTLINETSKSQNIGLHSGFDTHNDEKEYKSQKLKLETLVSKKITKSRQHFLRFDMSSTPYIIENSEIDEDYTLGFAEQFGFRNGIANPFYLFNFKEQRAFHFKSIPLVFMDVSLVNYNIENSFKTRNEVISFINKTKENFNCQFSILFHNSVFTKGKYSGFEEMYIELISE